MGAVITRLLKCGRKGRGESQRNSNARRMWPDIGDFEDGGRGP